MQFAFYKILLYIYKISNITMIYIIYNSTVNKKKNNKKVKYNNQDNNMKDYSFFDCFFCCSIELLCNTI